MLPPLLKGPGRALLRRLHRLPGFTERAADLQIKRLPAQMEKMHDMHGLDPGAAIDLGEIMDLLRQQRDGRPICNIIGSGPSVLAALQEPIDPTAAYFTCNFGGLLPLPYDLYLLEMGSYSPKLYDMSELQRRTIRALPKQPRAILIKNIWESKVEGRYVSSAYPDAFISLDALFPFAQRLLDDESYRFVFERFFCHNTKIMLQIRTSVLTLIQLAYRAGYTELRVFGLDGVGPHFFHDTRIRTLSPVASEVAEFIKPRGDNEKHQAGHSGRSLARRMHHFLLERGVHLKLMDLADQR